LQNGQSRVSKQHSRVAAACSRVQEADGMDVVTGHQVQTTDQDPAVTVAWAMRSLERALQQLGDGPSERRVRGQFHQLVLAIERQGASLGQEAHEPPADDDSPTAA